MGAAQPMPELHFGNSFAFTEGKLFAAGDMPGTGAQMSQNSVANKIFAKTTITHLHAKLPEGMPATVIASTPSTFMAYGKQRILPLLEAVQRVEELSPSGSLNCSAINQDGALKNMFGQWEVNTFQGLTDFSKRVEAVIPGNAWDGGVQIPERRIQFQFHRVLRKQAAECYTRQAATICRRAKDVVSKTKHVDQTFYFVPKCTISRRQQKTKYNKRQSTTLVLGNTGQRINLIQ